MTRNSDLDLEDLVACDHEPETPVIDDNDNITGWLCRCGRPVLVTPKEDAR